MLTLVPGFGADYDTVEELIRAWEDDREFVVLRTGRYVSRSQLEETGVVGGSVTVRFRNRTAMWRIDGLPERSGESVDAE